MRISDWSSDVCSSDLTAWISILSPRYHIPAHSGVTKGILRAHLGLIVPREREKCRIRIGDEVRYWEPGKIFVIDDTYEHEVWNERSEEHTSELQSLMRTSYAVSSLKTKVLTIYTPTSIETIPCS